MNVATKLGLVSSADVFELAAGNIDWCFVWDVKVIVIDVGMLGVQVVALGLRFGGDACRGIFVVAVRGVEASDLLIMSSLIMVRHWDLLKHFCLGLVVVNIGALGVHWWLWSVTLSRLLNRLAGGLRFSFVVADLFLDCLIVVAIVVESQFGLHSLDRLFPGSGGDLIHFVHLPLQPAEHINCLIVHLVLLDGGQGAENS